MRRRTPPTASAVAGFVGFAIGGPLSDGLTPWIATPLLIIGMLFGLLLVTGTTIREVPDAVQAMFMGAYRGDVYDDEYDEDDDDDARARRAEDFSDGYYDDPAAVPRRRGAVARRGLAGCSAGHGEPLRHPDGELSHSTSRPPTRRPTAPEPKARASARSEAPKPQWQPSRTPCRSTASSRGRTCCRRWTCSSQAIRRSCAAPPTTR